MTGDVPTTTDLRLHVEIIIEIFEYAALTSDGRQSNFWAKISLVCSWARHVAFLALIRSVSLFDIRDREAFKIRVSQALSDTDGPSPYRNAPLVRSVWIEGLSSERIYAPVLHYCTGLTSLVTTRRVLGRLHRIARAPPGNHPKDTRLAVNLHPRPFFHVTLLDGIWFLDGHLIDSTPSAGSPLLEMTTHLYSFLAYDTRFDDPPQNLRIPADFTNLTHIAFTFSCMHFIRTAHSTVRVPPRHMDDFLDHCHRHQPRLQVILVVLFVQFFEHKYFRRDKHQNLPWLRTTREWCYERQEIDRRVAVRTPLRCNAKDWETGCLRRDRRTRGPSFGAHWRQHGGEGDVDALWDVPPVDAFWRKLFQDFAPSGYHHLGSFDSDVQHRTIF